MNIRRKSAPEVELNLAAMLDMAFQILVFFVLTFRPAAVEGQVELRMPPPKPFPGNTDGSAEAGNCADPLKDLKTLSIVLANTEEGKLRQIRASGEEVAVDPKLAALDARLKKLLGDPASPFDQIVIQVGPKMRYDELMRVLDVCSRQRLPGGEKLKKLSLKQEDS
jgi:biopolymer transport protein ExbD